MAVVAMVSVVVSVSVVLVVSAMVPMMSPMRIATVRFVSRCLRVRLGEKPNMR